jgi:signal transduction histidine kinase
LVAVRRPRQRWRLDSVAAGALLALLLFAVWQVIDQWVLSEKLRVTAQWLYFTLDDLVETGLALTVLTLVIRALRARSQELEELNRQKDLLTNLLVHDLRQPLTAMLGSLSLAGAESTKAGEAAKFLGMAQQSGTLMARMLEDLLDVSHLEAGRPFLSISAVQPREFLEPAAAELAATAQQRGVELTVDLAPDLPPVRGDGPRLQRVVANLLDNALRYTPSGGRVVVQASLEAAQARIVVSVSDTGAGIPRDLQTRIFEKFWTGGNEASAARRSFGLGLTFCKMIVEAHGGRLQVESEPGKGATFRFDLPCAREEASGREDDARSAHAR